MTQLEFMEQDTVLVLDAKDTIIGSASKKDSHVFAGGQPYGILHRAFSVFLIDASTGKMLLQQRAASKITFPNVRVVWNVLFETSQSACGPVWLTPLSSPFSSLHDRVVSG